MTRAQLAAVVVAVASLLEGAAHADAPPAPAGQKAAAQVIFEQGRALVEQGHFAEACPKFAESQKIDPGIGTLLWLADCYENNGQTASAWATFKEAAAAAAQAQDKRESVARERGDALEPKLPRLMILVSSEAASQGLVVERDGVELGPTEWGLPVPIDPGVHTVAARAPDRKPWSTTVQLAARPGTLQVTVPALDAAAAPPPATPLVSPAAVPPPTTYETPPAATPGSTQRTVGLVVGGVGVIGLGIGTYFALYAKSTYDGASSNGNCLANNECTGAGKQERSDAYTQATVATVAMSAGAAALVGGAALYFFAPRAEPVVVGVVPNGRGGSIHVSVSW